MELGQAEAVGVDHHHHCGVRNIDADLDDRGGDQDVDGPGSERLHGHLFVLGPDAPMEQAQAEAGQLVGTEVVEGLLGRAGLELVGLLDERAHHEGLVAGLDLLAHPCPRLNLVEVGARPSGGDRCPPRG